MSTSAESRCIACLTTSDESSPKDLHYVLVTPARNEAAFIGQTITSVVAQSVLPEKWVIVSDGSTDGTDEIVRKYASQYRWIELLRMPERKERHFAGKVHAFNAGYSRLQHVEYDVIGSLDADISFDQQYFQFLLKQFANNPRLGVAGTPFKDDSLQHNYRFVSSEHVSGACQLFRRACFKEIGGYMAIKTGGIDLVAVTTARMKGWQTKSFPEKICLHHRKQGSARYGAFSYALKDGRGDYLLGCGIIWQLLRCSYRLFTTQPIVLSASVCLAGYLWAMVSRTERVVPPEFITFRRKEERGRLREFFRKARRWRT